MLTRAEKGAGIADWRPLGHFISGAARWCASLSVSYKLVIEASCYTEQKLVAGSIPVIAD